MSLRFFLLVTPWLHLSALRRHWRSGRHLRNLFLGDIVCDFSNCSWAGQIIMSTRGILAATDIKRCQSCSGVSCKVLSKLDCVEMHTPVILHDIYTGTNLFVPRAYKTIRLAISLRMKRWWKLYFTPMSFWRLRQKVEVKRVSLSGTIVLGMP